MGRAGVGGGLGGWIVGAREGLRIEGSMGFANAIIPPAGMESFR